MFLKIIKIKPEAPDCTSLIFEKPPEFFYYTGQYLDIKLPVDDPYGGNTRAFTISSSPTENFLMITFKKGISVFKKSLENLKVGDAVEVSHPAGTFTLDETEPAVFIAGGIGITPFRSMFKYVVDNHLKTKIELIYANSSKDFVFKEIFDNSLSSIINTSYINTNQNTRLNQSYFEPIVTMYDNSIFYISGSESFIMDIKKHLINLGVEEFNIRTDNFDGYD